MALIDRRAALRRLGLISGGIITGPAITSFLSGCTSQPEGYSYQFLTSDDLVTLRPLLDVIIPPTDTPGASEAGVDTFFDQIMEGGDTGAVEAVRKILSKVEEAAGDRAFARLAPGDQIDAVQTVAESEPQAFDELKWAAILGYYTSEIGATQELQFSFTFARFEGAVPTSEIGAAWAPHGL